MPTRHAINQPRPEAIRFWEKVRKTDSCWIWTASTTHFGYGHFHAGSRTNGTRRQVNAHRFSWELRFGGIPAGKLVCHHCDNPRCVKPSHLFLGSVRDNALDASRKWRMNNGERHGLSKLRDSDVVAMRAEWRAGGVRQRMLARKYSVSPSTISGIMSGRSWRHLAGDPGAT